jgi:hypothetical protein
MVSAGDPLSGDLALGYFNRELPAIGLRERQALSSSVQGMEPSGCAP